MGLLTGKRALIVGVASNRSIAWGIAQAMHREGAELAYTYQNEKLQGRVEKFAGETGSDITLPCDVSDDAQISGVFTRLNEHWPHLDILVHSVAFADRELLEGDYLSGINRAGFLRAQRRHTVRHPDRFR
ncbi:MAG: SDR family oxidoreductase, partial [Gammaproteobacteria bacterium]|nr:SDR family oxidoreductase [Gammaproteobacteria bacterium]